MSVVEVAVVAVAVAVEVTEALDYNVCSSDCHTGTKLLIKIHGNTCLWIFINYFVAV